ncbi:unnamed protein product [Sympodiomycopsis kandeliae]
MGTCLNRSSSRVLDLFTEARQVFDTCDSLREGYYEANASSSPSSRNQADSLRKEASSLLKSIDLDSDDLELKSEWSYAQAEAHADENRWYNVRPWNHTVLPGDYLNASTVSPIALKTDKGLTAATSQPFVASQAPLPNTLPTFLHHLLSTGCKLLINLTPVFDMIQNRQIRKSNQYWPDHGMSTFDAGNGWTIRTIREDIDTTSTAGTSGRSTRSGDDWKIIRRELEISPPKNWHAGLFDSYKPALYGQSSPTTAASPPTPKSDSKWTLTHLHIESWADGGSSSAINFTRLVELVERTQQQTLSPEQNTLRPPIWIHCSAGIGRTGTLIGGLIARETLSGTSTMPAETVVLLIWEYLRQRRYGMITTPQQAKMIYDEVTRLRNLRL